MKNRVNIHIFYVQIRVKDKEKELQRIFAERERCIFCHLNSLPRSVNRLCQDSMN